MKQTVQVLAAMILVILASAVTAQEQSVKPGINDNFENPNVETYTQMFEGESREIYRHRMEIAEALALQPGDNVADIGAGTGFFSLIFSEDVGESGTVYAVDIAENFIEHIARRASDAGASNVEAVLCTDRSTELPPDSIDVAFICDTYHHFEYPYDTMASVHRALRDGGRLMIVDFERVRGISRDWTLNHVRCGKGTVTDEVKDSGFEFLQEISMMDEQYVLVFQKRGPVADGE